MKTICFDLRALQIGHQNRGIGMYIKSVLENLPEDKNINYLFYCFDKNNPLETLGISTKINYELIQTPTINTVLDSPKNIVDIIKLTGHRFKELRNYHVDVFVQFDFMLGMPRWRDIKKVVIGYDLIPLIMKNEYMPSINFAWNHSAGKRAKIKAVLRSIYYRFRYHLHYKVFKKADKVICISDASAASFHKLLHLPSSKISSLALAPVIGNNEPNLSIADTISKPYIFYIGGTDSRKRIEDIVYAFNIARGRGEKLALVLAGNEFSKLDTLPNVHARNAILNSPYRHDIHLVGFVSDSQKMGLYSKARAFVFCSTFEGFGLPVVESMAAGCPVITYSNSSITESAGDAAILVKTGDFNSISNAIISLRNDGTRSELVTRGLKNAQKYSWTTYTEKFLQQII